MNYSAIMSSLDLLSVVLPDFSMEEDNIAVYLAGYLAKKAKDKFNCPDCLALWCATQDEKDTLCIEHTFFDHKQYKDHACVNDGGLTAPSKLLLQATTDMEKTFRCVFPIIVHNPDLFANLMLSFQKRVKTESLVCSPKCEKAKMYLLTLYGKVRLHHALKMENRGIASSKKGTRKNRKCMKLFHM